MSRWKLLASILLLPLWLTAAGSASAPVRVTGPAVTAATELSPAAPAITAPAEAGWLLADGVRTTSRAPRGGTTTAGLCAMRTAVRSHLGATARLRLDYTQPLTQARLNIPATYGNPPPLSHS